MPAIKRKCLVPGKEPLKRLTRKQRRFCHEYMVDLSGTRAAIRAKYSRKSAPYTSSHLLKEPLIQAYIDELFAAMDTDADRRAKRLREELQTIALSDASDIVKTRTVDGKKEVIVKPQKHWPRGVAVEIRQRSNGELSVKIANKIQAANLLAKMDGLIKDKQQVQLDPIPKDIASLTDEELNDKLAELEAMDREMGNDTSGTPKKTLVRREITEDGEEEPS